jgi:hypothetical protein
VSPPQKEPKKKQNQKKMKKQDAGVKHEKDSFPIYDPSLFSSFDAPKWLDVEQEWCIGTTYCTNFGDRETPFTPQWRRDLPDATKSLELRSNIFQHKVEVEYNRYMYYTTKSFSQFVISSFIHFFLKMSTSIFECFFAVFVTLNVRRGSMTTTYKMA